MIYRPPKANAGPAVWIFAGVTVIAAVVVAWLGISSLWGSATLRYEVTGAHAIIHWGPTAIEIDRDSIVDVAFIESPTRGRRHVGINMAGLKQGRWSFAETGPVSLYATTTRGLVTIEAAGQKWGISPAEPEAFIEALETGQPGVFEPVEQSAAAGLTFMAILTLVIVALPAGLITSLRRLVRNIGYELRDDELWIHGSWRPVRIPYRTIDSVRVEERPAGHTTRIVGTALPGLMWGSFSWRSLGPNVKLYVTRLQPLVVLQTGGRTVGLSPEDAEGFSRELKRRIGKD